MPAVVKENIRYHTISYASAMKPDIATTSIATGKFSNPVETMDAGSTERYKALGVFPSADAAAAALFVCGFPVDLKNHKITDPPTAAFNNAANRTEPDSPNLFKMN